MARQKMGSDLSLTDCANSEMDAREMLERAATRFRALFETDHNEMALKWALEIEEWLGN